MAHAEVGDAHDKRAVLRVAVNAKLGDFREMRFYRRGHHKEVLEVAEWFGWRRRKSKVDVYDDVVLFAAMRSKAEIASRRELRRLERRKIPAGSVLLKYFRNIAAGDLKALFPNARVVMRQRRQDRARRAGAGERHSDPDQPLHHDYRAVSGDRLLSRR